MTSSSSSTEVSAPEIPSLPRPSSARPAVSQEKMLLPAVEREIERSGSTRRSSWTSPLRRLVRKATKKGKNVAASMNLLLPPPSQSRTRQEEREAAKNGAGDAQGSSSVSKKPSEATAALYRPACAARMKRASARIQAGDASDDADAFTEMEQAMNGLMDALFKEKTAPLLPGAGVFMSNLRCVDDNGWSEGDIITDRHILAFGDPSVDRSRHQWSSSQNICPVTDRPLSHSVTLPNDLLRDMIAAWCHDYSLCSSCSTVETLPVAPSEEEIGDILQKFAEHSTLQEQALHDIQLLSKITKGEQPCLVKWPVLIPMLIDLQKNWNSTWREKLEELRLTIILNLSVHRPNKEILAGAAQLPDALKKITDKLPRLGGCPVSAFAKVSFIVANLSGFEDFRKRILDICGMEMLRNLLKIEDVVVRKEAVTAICVLCTDQEGKESCNVSDLLVECLTITDEALVLLDCPSKDAYVLDKLSDKTVELVNIIMADQAIELVTPKAMHSAVSLAQVILQRDKFEMDKLLKNSRDKRSRILEPEEANKDCWSWAIAALRVVLLSVSSVGQTVLFPIVECCFGHRRLLEAPGPGYSWLSVMGSPIVNTDSSCTISACAMCIVAQHRLAFERLHGKGSFPCKAKVPRELKLVCTKRDVWNSESGALVSDVLQTIIDMGGLLTTREPKAIRLQIDGYILIKDSKQQQLRRDRFARILYARGPVIGALWVSNDDYDTCVGDRVYRGCPRQQRIPGSGGYHGVVCFGYEFTSDKKDLQIRIMDNYTAEGPLRWVLFEAFDYLYLPVVKQPIEPQQLLRQKRKSKEHTLSVMVKKVKLWLINREARRYFT